MKKLDEVLKQISALQSQADSIRDKERASVIAQIKEQIAAYEITEKQLFKTRKPAKPKYQSKDDPSLTWTGKGKAPAWIVAFEKKGGKRDSLLIK